MSRKIFFQLTLWLAIFSAEISAASSTNTAGRPFATASRLPTAENIPLEKFRSGDIIFHISQSSQSGGIAEVQKSPWSHVGILYKQGSDWSVFEAIQPVSVTPLKKFIQRSKNGVISVKRVRKDLVDLDVKKNIDKIFKEAQKFKGRNYDLFFQWSDSKIYCSELVYKVFERAFGIEIGKKVTVGELDFSGPKGQQLLKEREKLMGQSANAAEPIVTPASQYFDPNLIPIFEN